MLVSRMRNELRDENKYLITKRNEVSEALKETMRISSLYRKQKEKRMEEKRIKMHLEIGE